VEELVSEKLVERLDADRQLAGIRGPVEPKFQRICVVRFSPIRPGCATLLQSTPPIDASLGIPGSILLAAAISAAEADRLRSALVHCESAVTVARQQAVV
jgi:hypothetical protein